MGGITQAMHTLVGNMQNRIRTMVILELSIIMIVFCQAFH